MLWVIPDAIYSYVALAVFVGAMPGEPVAYEVRWSSAISSDRDDLDDLHRVSCPYIFPWIIDIWEFYMKNPSRFCLIDCISHVIGTGYLELGFCVSNMGDDDSGESLHYIEAFMDNGCFPDCMYDGSCADFISTAML